MDVKEEDILGNQVGSHWYYRSKGKALLDMLHGVPADPVVDVGAGSGFFSKLLLRAGLAGSAECVDPAYPEEHETTIDGRPLRFRRQSGEQPVALILMMDVIEHVDDDVALVREYLDRLQPGGHVLITVPAFNWLWSGHDDFLEHRRRYTRASLEKVIEEAGLEVVKTRYFFGSLLPLVVPIRLWDKLVVKAGKREPRSSLRRHASWVNGLLSAVLNVERWLLFPVNRVAGLSVFCVARKR